MFDAVYRPGVALGSYPEKKFEQRPALEKFIGGALRRLRARSGGGLADGERFVAEVMAASEQFKGVSDEDFKSALLRPPPGAATQGLRARANHSSVCVDPRSERANFRKTSF